MTSNDKLLEGFAILSPQKHRLKIDLKYTGFDNLIGRPLRGYDPDGSAILTNEAIFSLLKIIKELQKPSFKRTLGMSEPTLIIWEAYRPKRAGEDFWEWSLTSCEKTKANYYPNINKKDFFKLGYVVRLSSHSRGSTVDLNIIDLVNNNALDMGTPFDFMDPLSHPGNKAVGKKAFLNRLFLKQLMNEFGWQGIEQEWWHFTYSAEPFPQTYFDFPVMNYEK